MEKRVENVYSFNGWGSNILYRYTGRLFGTLGHGNVDVRLFLFSQWNEKECQQLRMRGREIVVV